MQYIDIINSYSPCTQAERRRGIEASEALGEDFGADGDRPHNLGRDGPDTRAAQHAAAECDTAISDTAQPIKFSQK